MSASADLASRLVNKAAGPGRAQAQSPPFCRFSRLRRADAPAVLFEAGYLSNADDELLLRNPAERAKIVLALAQAIEARRCRPRATLTHFPRFRRQARRFRE